MYGNLAAEFLTTSAALRAIQQRRCLYLETSRSILQTGCKHSQHYPTEPSHIANCKAHAHAGSQVWGRQPARNTHRHYHHHHCPSFATARLQQQGQRGGLRPAHRPPAATTATRRVSRDTGRARGWGSPGRITHLGAAASWPATGGWPWGAP